MTREEAKAAVTGKLIEAYGFTEGLSVSGVCAEPIVADFVRMIGHAAPGQIISEDYKTEDRRAVIRLRGVRENGAVNILSAELAK